MIALNHKLPSLPSIGGTPLNRPKNHAQVCALLDARRAAALQIAESIMDLASTVLGRGDFDAASDLMAEANLYHTEVLAIDARRVA